MTASVAEPEKRISPGLASPPSRCARDGERGAAPAVPARAARFPRKADIVRTAVDYGGAGKAGPRLTPNDCVPAETSDRVVASFCQPCSCSIGAYETPMTAPSGDCSLATVWPHGSVRGGCSNS